MDNKIKQQIEYLCKDFGMELTSIKPQKNKTVSFTVKSHKDVKQNKDFYKAIKNLDCVNTFFQRNFRMGKKEEACCWYQISVIINDDYFNGVLDTSKPSGQIIKFFIDNNIKTAKDLFETTYDILKDMQLFTRTIKDRQAKKKIWNVKLHYIKYLFKNGLIDEVASQISYSNDRLIRFTIKGEHHWLRQEDVDFVPSNAITKLDEIYTLEHKRNAAIEIITENKELKESDFDLHVNLFRQLNNDVLLRCAGMDIPDNEFWW